MRRMGAPAAMQAMPSIRLLMLTVISFPPGLRLMRLRQFCPRGSWPGFGAGGWNWGGMLVFSSGLMALFHRRPSTGGFRCALPEGIGSPEGGLSQTKPVGKSSESRFKAVSTSGVSLWCCGCHEGICGRCWRLSEAFQREVRGLVPPQHRWGGGLWTARSLFSMGPRNRWRKRLSRVELLPGARFRIPVQNPAGALGSGLVGKDPPGSSTIRVVHRFSLLSFQP